MSGSPTLNLPVKWNYQESLTIKSTNTMLGDGYQQFSVHGVVFGDRFQEDLQVSATLSQSEKSTLEGLLRAWKGVVRFNWTPMPGAIAPQLYVCEKWNFKEAGQNVWDFSATFERKEPAYGLYIPGGLPGDPNTANYGTDDSEGAFGSPNAGTPGAIGEITTYACVDGVCTLQDGGAYSSLTECQQYGCELPTTDLSVQITTIVVSGSNAFWENPFTAFSCGAIAGVRILKSVDSAGTPTIALQVFGRVSVTTSNPCSVSPAWVTIAGSSGVIDYDVAIASVVVLPR